MAEGAADSYRMMLAGSRSREGPKTAHSPAGDDDARQNAKMFESASDA